MIVTLFDLQFRVNNSWLDLASDKMIVTLFDLQLRVNDLRLDMEYMTCDLIGPARNDLWVDLDLQNMTC
jgi:hypothetical protein